MASGYSFIHLALAAILGVALGLVLTYLIGKPWAAAEEAER